MLRTILKIIFFVTVLCFFSFIIINLRPPIRKPENLFQSKHFDIYYTDESIDLLEKLSLRLESHYKRNIAFFRTDSDKRFNIYLFPNLSVFHKATDKPDDAMSKAVNERIFLSIERDLINAHSFSNKAYPYSSVFVEFLIETRGNDFILMMLDDYENSNNNILAEVKNIQKEWEEFLIEKYVDMY